MTTFDSAITNASGEAARPVKPFLKIRPRRGWIGVNLEEMWRFRDLMWSLVGRDIKLRYKQTALGIAWVVLQPIVGAGIFSFVFGNLARLPVDKTANGSDVPYYLFSFASLVVWNMVSNTISKLSGILVGNSALVGKVYFPRLMLPLSGAIGVLVDTAVAYLLLLAIQLFQHIGFGPQMLLTPIMMLPMLALSMGIGMWAAALCVQYRDVAAILPVALQFLMYASPVAYSTSVLDRHPVLYYFYYLNPMAALLQAWRWCVLTTPFPPMWAFLYAVAISLLMLLAGTMVFRRMERTFADVI